MPQLRIALMLPGEASLGAFEGGAVSALLTGVQALNVNARDDVVVDVIAGSSSGALTAVLGARVLLSGEDPVAPLHRAWVREPSIKALRTRDRRAPLSLERARDVAYELLAANPRRTGPAQRHEVTLTFALTCLRGLRYQVKALRTHDDATTIRSIPATTYVDWARFDFTRARFTDEWAFAVDAAIASASHPLAFAPAVLDRERDRRDYERHGITNLPKSPLEFWYADGGLVDRQPLGRCLNLVAERDRCAPAGRRLVLLVHTDCDVTPSEADLAWTDAEERPDWSATLGRALRVISSHSVYEDLRRAQKTNSHIEWLRSVASTLSQRLDAIDDQALREALAAELAKIAVQKEQLSPKLRGTPPPDASCALAAPEASGALAAVLENLLLSAAGVESKIQVDISEVLGRGADVAGSSLGGFGGFFAERPRAQDFLLGYRDMLAWMEHNLADLGRDADVALAAARARGANIPGWIGGRGQVLRPALRSRAQAVGLGARALGIGLRERIGRE